MKTCSGVKSLKERECHDHHGHHGHHDDHDRNDYRYDRHHDDHQESRTKGNVSAGLFSLRCCDRPFKSDSLSL